MLLPGIIPFYMAPEHQQREHEGSGGRGNKSWGKYVVLRQQQRHISSRNAAIISLSLLPSCFFFFFSSITVQVSFSLSKTGSAKRRNREKEWDRTICMRECGKQKESANHPNHSPPTLSCCPCPGCRWAADPAGLYRSSVEWSLCPSLPRRNRGPSESYRRRDGKREKRSRQDDLNPPLKLFAAIVWLIVLFFLSGNSLH